jgi:hypothetical protein
MRAASSLPSWSTLAAASLLCCGVDNTTPSQCDWAACHPGLIWSSLLSLWCWEC